MDHLDVYQKQVSAASGTSMRAFSVHLVITFILVAILVNHSFNWVDAQLRSQRAALAVLNLEYPNDDKVAPVSNSLAEEIAAEKKMAKLRHDGYIQILNQELAPSSPPTKRKLSSKQLNTFIKGQEYLEWYFAPYKLDVRAQRMIVRNVLSADMAEDERDRSSQENFQLPLIGVPFDSSNEAVIFGIALICSGAVLLTCLLREYLLASSLRDYLSRNCDVATDDILAVCREQFASYPTFGKNVLASGLRLASLVLGLFAVWFPPCVVGRAYQEVLAIPYLAAVNGTLKSSSEFYGGLVLLCLGLECLVTSVVILRIRRLWSSVAEACRQHVEQART